MPITFLDTPKQFTPYIPTNPSEAYVNVGMKLQEQHDLAVQKIQGQVDSLTGIQFAKKGAKEYVDSQINNIKTGLAKNLGADISNQVLQSQIGGAIKTIGNDPVVQANIIGTANMKAGYAQRDKAKSEGKSAIQNEWDYENQVGSWLNDGKLDTPFNGSYKPYTDPLTKLKDIAKEVGIDESDIQQLYQTDENGNILKDAQGNAQWNPIMVEKITKGKDPQKILGAFKNALTPDDYNQLSIDGRYNYRGTSTEGLLFNINSAYDESKDYYDKLIKNQDVKIASAKNDPAQATLVDQLKEQRLLLANNLETVEKNRKRDLEAATSNPEGAKASLYTNRYLQSMANAFSSSVETNKYSVSPMFEVTMRQNEFNLKLRKENRDDEELQLKKKKALEEDNNPTYIPTSPLSITDNNAIKSAFEENIQAHVDTRNLDAQELAVEWMRTNPENATKSKEEILKGIKQLADANHEDVSVMNNRFASYLVGNKDYKPSNELQSTIDSYNDNIKQIAANQAIYDQKVKETIAWGKSQNLNFDDVNGKDAQINPVKITMNGNPVTLSKEDVLNLAKGEYHTSQGIAPDFMDSKAVKDAAKTAKANFEKKYGEGSYDDAIKELSVINDIRIPLNPFPVWKQSTIANEELRKAISLVGKSGMSKYADKLGELLKNNTVFPLGATAGVFIGKNKPEDIDTKIYSVIDNASQADEAKSMMKEMYGKDKSSVIVKWDEKGKSYLKIGNKSGSSDPIEINPKDATYLTGVDYVPQENEPSFSLLKASKTTNLNGKEAISENDWSTSMYKPNEFTTFNEGLKQKGLQGYTLNADLVKDGRNPGVAWLKVYLHKPDGTTQLIPYNQSVSLYDANGAPNNLLLKNIAKGVTLEELNKITNGIIK